MEGVKQGNAVIDGRAHRSWIVGWYIEEDPLRKTNDLEVKWAIHKPGEANGVFAADRVARSLSILVRGRFRLQFRKGDTLEEMVLEKEGDYALWQAGVEHAWFADGPDDAVVVTVRWPSLPIKQIERH
jgi:hypothetical protein